MRRNLLACGVVFSALVLPGCGAGDEDSSFDSRGASPGGGAGGGPTFPGVGGENGGGAVGGAARDADAGAPLPPEKEVDLPFDTPQAGRNAVYVPNPGTHRVAVVDAKTFSIETLSAGLSPTYAATVPGQDLAVVLNVGSADAAILRTTDGKTEVTRLPIGHDQNAIAVSPDGAHAVIYFDARAAPTARGSAQSFQDVSVLRLVEGQERVRGVSVGFRPRGVQFSADGSRAFVVTEDGVSIIDLAPTGDAPVIAKLIPVGDKVGQPVSLDVQIVADGAFAIARRDGEGGARLIDLENGEIESLRLDTLQPPPSAPAMDAGTSDAGVDAGVEAGPADAGLDAAGGDAGSPYPLPAGALDLTDLDVVPDGKFALAVVRNAGALLRIPIPDGFRDPTQVEVQVIKDVLIGSVVISKRGNLAALYTTAQPTEAMVLLDLASGSERAVRLRKSVRAVAFSEGGERAFVLHATGSPPGVSDAEEQRIDASEGYSLVDTASGFAKLQLTAAAVRERDLLVTPDASRVFVLLRNDGQNVRVAHMADLGSFQVKLVTLAKPPSSLGFVPDADRVFIGQQSEGGMITFLDAESGDVVRAVSGFELSGRVRQ
jgi:DNA-binding beta-propeller fold protein YncE